MSHSKREKFRLPAYEELSKEQDRVLRRLQLDGRYLVCGAPGTGKTVITLLFANKLKQNNKNSLCILYNRTLENMSLSLVNNIDVKTWHSWFCSFFRKQYKQMPPQVENYVYDWDKIEEIYFEHEPEIISDRTILIDEGQDMPPEFYDFMAEHFQNVFVSADENQQICDTNSSVKQIKERLEIEDDNLFFLNKNYRNTHQIAQLAGKFYCGTAADPPPLPEVNGEIPVLFEYEDKKNMMDKIAQRHDIYPDKLIGIIAPNNRVREEYHQQLFKRKVGSLYTYANSLGGNNRSIQFEHGGIVVINANSAKGLEFEEVFIADLQDYNLREPGDEILKKLMYVLLSRAKERLFLLIDKNAPSYKRKILNEFPDDSAILRKWSQKRGKLNYG